MNERKLVLLLSLLFSCTSLAMEKVEFKLAEEKASELSKELKARAEKTWVQLQHMPFVEAIGLLVNADEEPLIKQLIIDKYRLKFLERFSYFQSIHTGHNNPLAFEVCGHDRQYMSSVIT